MNKEELRDVVLNKVDEKYKEIELNLARYKETGYPDYLRICTEAKGFNDGVEWLIEKLSEVDDI